MIIRTTLIFVLMIMVITGAIALVALYPHWIAAILFCGLAVAGFVVLWKIAAMIARRGGKI